MRLFVALDLENEIRERIRTYIEQMRPLASNGRWTGPESLHVTLKFIGEQPDQKATDIEAALSRVSAAEFDVSFRGCGFFPNAKSGRVFWVGIDAGPALPKLAADIEDSLVPLRIEKEKRAFNPHLTLARAKGGSGAPGRQTSDRRNQVFAAVQSRLSKLPPPEFGTMAAREFFLYRSQLSKQGSRYTKLARFALQSGNA